MQCNVIFTVRQAIFKVRGSSWLQLNFIRNDRTAYGMMAQALANFLGGAIRRQKTNLTETGDPVAQVFTVGTFIIQTALIAAMDIIVNTSGSSKNVNINV